MTSDDYEIMPHKEIAGLKEELKKLKTKSLHKTSRLDAESMDNLAASIQELMTLFKEASKDLKNEENEESHILEKLTEAIDTMNTIVYQNEKIAEGIVTVAEMIKDHMPKEAAPQASSSVLGVPVLGKESNTPAPAQPTPPANPSAPPDSAIPYPNSPDMFSMPSQGMPPPTMQQMNSQPPPSVPPMNSQPPPSMPPMNSQPPPSMPPDSMPPPPTPPPQDIPPPSTEKKGFLDRFK